MNRSRELDFWWEQFLAMLYLPHGRTHYWGPLPLGTRGFKYQKKNEPKKVMLTLEIKGIVFLASKEQNHTIEKQ
jgi:hypothetical protein